VPGLDILLTAAAACGDAGTQLDLDVTAGLLALGPPRPNLPRLLADPTALATDPVLSHFRPVAQPSCWQEYVTLMHVRQLDAAAGRTPLPPGCPPGATYLQHMCEQLNMLTRSGLAHATKPPKKIPPGRSGGGSPTPAGGSQSKSKGGAAGAAATAAAAAAAAPTEGELFWPRLRVLTERAHWALTIIEGLRRFGLLDEEGAAPVGEKDSGPLHIHIIGAQDNKDEGTTTAATFR
jgi:hypothetical protein